MKDLRLLLLMAAAAGLRLIGIPTPPYEFHPTIQFETALNIRTRLWSAQAEAPLWQKEIAARRLREDARKEPPIMETIGTWGARLLGRDTFWFPRLVSVLFWLWGSLVLHRLAVFLYGPRGSLLAPAAYLFFPFGISIGRGLMPEALLTLTFFWAVLALARAARDPRTAAAVRAAVACGAAILVKLIAVFPLGMAFALLQLQRLGWKRSLRSGRTWLFLLVGGAVPLAYYVATLLGSATLGGVARSVIRPGLPTTWFFWSGWLTQIGKTVGFLPFLLALLAMIRLKDRTTRTFLFGLLLGYAVYGLAFSYATATHDYYQVPLFWFVVLALGALGPAGAAAWERARPRRMTRALLAAAAAAVPAFLVLATADSDLLSARAKAGWSVPAAVLCGNQLTSWTPPPPEGLRRTAEEIGRIVGHSRRTIFLAYEYGLPLQYFGGLGGDYWPDRRDVWARGLRGAKDLPPEERFERDYRRRDAEFFIVDDLRKWEADPPLRSFLESRFPLLARAERFLVFDLRGGTGRRRGG